MTLTRLIKKAKSKLRYALWRSKVFVTSRKASALYDVHKTYWIDPGRIEFARDHRAADRLDPTIEFPVSPVEERGKIVGGDWDRDVIRFDEMDVWEAFVQHFNDGAPWEQTGYYERCLKAVTGGAGIFGCRTPEDLDARMVTIDALYESIKTDGYRVQADNANTLNKTFHTEDEVHVHIGRDGDYIFADGRHRLCIAKLLKLEKIPVKVARRHAAWVDLRQEILNYAANHNGQLYAPIHHPDLADIPSTHTDERLDLLGANLPETPGTMLEIGPHWGFFSHWFEQQGYCCTAIENDPHAIRMLEKLRRADRREFRIVTGSVLQWEPDQPYDVVLGLNIFHHFLKDEKEYGQFVALLENLDAKTMFFQPHCADEPQMVGAYRNYDPEAFVAFVQEHGGFSRATKLGNVQDGRPVYRLDA